MEQCDQDNRSGLGLAGYVMWKSNTKSVIWVSLNAKIHSDLFLVFLYSSQIILYRSLYAYWWLILESTIWEILYLGPLSIITGVEAGYVLLEKELDMVDLSIDT